MISLNSNSYNYEIADYKYNRYENVLNYNYPHCTPLLHINTHDMNITQEKEIYYIFDCPGQDAFVHWVYESFIFVDYFLEINKIYPNIKIITNNKKRYVNNFFKLFNINNTIVQTIDTSVNNICFFSPILSLNDKNIDQALFKNLIYNFINKINAVINKPALNGNIIFLPRNRIDNYAPNDRIIYGSEDIAENVIKLGGTVLDTYEIDNLKVQFDTLNTFKRVILDWGSSGLVNCIFVKDKKIILLDNYNMFTSQNSYPSINILTNIISDKNKVILVPGNNNTINFCDIERFLVNKELNQ